MNLNTNFVKHSVGIFARYIKKRFDDGPNPNHYDEEDEDDPDVQLERQLELERAGNCVQDTFEEESEP